MLRDVFMGQHEDEIDDLLVEWELARQNGRELDAAELCSSAQHLTVAVQQRIDLLRKTAWMLDDPAPLPMAPRVAEFVSEAARTYETSTENSKEVTHRDVRQPSLLTQRSDSGGSVSGRSSAPQMPHEPRRMPDIPGFRFVSELGAGGFGVVYCALDETLDRHVAIKFPLIDNAREREKYILEARNAARVDVPGLVPVFHVGKTSEGTPYVIQKLIKGKSLREIEKVGGLLSPRQVVDLLVPICRAVGAAHAQSLVHRDLKPANILVDEEGMPWIADFGLAVVEDEHSQARIAGTPNFMAPEQIHGEVAWLDGRCDIWALGIILYQALTGRLPFKAANPSELHQQILHLEPRPISQRQPNIHGEWDRIFRKCCAKSVADRYHSAYELAEDLIRLRDSLDPTTEKLNPVLHDLLKIGQAGGRLLPNLGGHRHWHTTKNLASLGLATLAVVLAVFAILSARGRNAGNAAANIASSEPAMTGKTAAAGTVSDAASAMADFVVSADGKGTHPSIEAALQDARETTNIIIEPGTYRESLTIAREVVLRGRGPLSEIKILGVDGPAFTINRGGELALRGLSVGVVEDSGDLCNTIEVRGGALLLESCAVSATGYDCVRLDAESQLIAGDCDFMTVNHPAIFSRLAEQIEIRDCRFTIGGPNTTDSAFLVGIQAKQSGGSVTRCSFTGRLATGIEWSDTDGLVNINDCNFVDLDRGVVAFACQELRVGGQGRSVFTECATAIELNNSGGSIRNCNIEARESYAAGGMLIRGMGLAGVPITVESCNIRGSKSPLTTSQTHLRATSLNVTEGIGVGISLLRNSYLELDTSEVRDCGSVGILLEGSRATLQRCTIANNPAAGVVVDGLDDALLAKSCLMDANGVGIIVLSGSASLENTNVKGSDTGVLLARKQLLDFRATCDALLSFNALGGSIDANLHAVEFLSPGSYKMLDCDTSDAENRPVLDARLEEQAYEDRVFVREKAEAK
jgi:serine/threonine protein kinase